MKKLNLKTRKKRDRLIRAAIQLLFFVVAPSLFSAAFSGIRYIVTQIHELKLIEWTSFVQILVVLLIFTAVFGRFFCGYACAFGSLGDAVYELSSFLQRKLRKKVIKISDKTLHRLQHLKYLVLAGIVAFCYFGWYAKVSKADPWELFASFTSGNFSLSGKSIAAVLLFAIVIGMCIVPRFFCQFLCPMGAVFSFIPVLPASILTKDKNNCIKGCGLCRKNCPAALDIESFSGECFQCGACSNVCPKGNIKTGMKRRFRGNEVVAVLVKAAILFAVCYPWM